MTPEAVDWHLNGEHGISSRAIFNYLHFGAVGGKWYGNWPQDPSDFRRCELLLKAVPVLRARLPEMAAVHPVWAALVARWDEIADLMEEEAREQTGLAPRTYTLMRDIIDSVERVAP